VLVYTVCKIEFGFVRFDDKKRTITLGSIEGSNDLGPVINIIATEGFDFKISISPTSIKLQYLGV
jgi:hypothetical protein